MSDTFHFKGRNKKHVDKDVRNKRRKTIKNKEELLNASKNRKAKKGNGNGAQYKKRKNEKEKSKGRC